LFDLAQPTAHRCSVGGEIFENNALYDQAWWRKVNQFLAQGVLSSALLHAASSDPSSVVESATSSYLEAARHILLEYASHYPHYAIHGDIPHNSPAKANCQTLDEATWIIPLALAYNVLQADLSQPDQVTIERDLLATCANFLLDHREQQLHNHQCWISAAIGVLGLVLQNKQLVATALYERWGLLEQLERGVSPAGLWCEGTLTYHFYAFDAFSSFARLQHPLAQALRTHPALLKMPAVALKLLLPDYSFPLLNDTTPPLGLAQVAPRYELAAAWFDNVNNNKKNSEYMWLLAQTYNRSGVVRDSLEALLYGPAEITATSTSHVPPSLTEDFVAEAGGLTILRQSAQRAGLSYILLKHNPYGGEHDHADRPGLYFGTANQPHLASDLGTVPYGLPLHYGFFKHTLTHNTVRLGGENQPAPAQISSSVQHFPDHTRLLCLCSWSSAVLNASYAAASIERTVLVADGYLLDVVKVVAPAATRFEYAFHWQAALLAEQLGSIWHPPYTPPLDFQEVVTPLITDSAQLPHSYNNIIINIIEGAASFQAKTKPAKLKNDPWLFLQKTHEADGSATTSSDWQVHAPEKDIKSIKNIKGEVWRLWCMGQPGQRFQIANGPANPFVNGAQAQQLGFWIVEVRNQQQHYFVHVFEALRATPGLCGLKISQQGAMLAVEVSTTFSPSPQIWLI
jgi:hypothetical protein